MKLASLGGSGDGRLVLVDAGLMRCVRTTGIAGTLQELLDDWDRLMPRLRDLDSALDAYQAKGAEEFAVTRCTAPLPRPPARLDALADSSPSPVGPSVMLRDAGGAEVLSATADVAVARTTVAIRCCPGIAVVTADVPLQSTADDIHRRKDIRLLVATNQWWLGTPGASAEFDANRATAFSASAVTPDGLGSAWDGRLLRVSLHGAVNGTAPGTGAVGDEVWCDFPALIEKAVRNRPLRAGTVLGVSFTDSSLAKAPPLALGDRVTIDVRDPGGHSPFGVISQRLSRAHRSTPG